MTNDYPGYRLTQRSRDVWARLTARGVSTQAEWDALQQRREVVEQTRRLIVWSQATYSEAKRQHARNMRVLTEITLNWSPERVLSKHVGFLELCQKLNDEITWKMLTRKERKFIADAVSLQ